MGRFQWLGKKWRFEMKKNYLSVRIDDEMTEQIKEVMELIDRKFPVPLSRGYKLRS